MRFWQKQKASKSRIYERTSKTRNIHQNLGECSATLCNTAPAFSSSRVCQASQKYSRKHEANVALILWQRFKRWTNIINFLWFLTMLTDFFLLRAGTDDSVLSVVARNSGVHSFFMVSKYCFISLSAQSWRYRDRRNPEAGTMPYSYLEWPQKFFIVRSAIGSTVHSRPLNSLEHCICTITMTNIRPDRDSRPQAPVDTNEPLGLSFFLWYFFNRHYYCYYVVKFAPLVNLRESPRS